MNRRTRQIFLLILALGFLLPWAATPAQTEAPDFTVFERRQKPMTDSQIKSHALLYPDGKGNEILTIPLSWPETDLDPQGSPNLADPARPSPSLIKELAEAFKPCHGLWVSHSHQAMAVQIQQEKAVVPLSEWAQAGFSITIDGRTEAKIPVSGELQGSLSLEQALELLKLPPTTVHRKAIRQSYTEIVPKGYLGRFVYGYTDQIYSFINRTTLAYPNNQEPYCRISETPCIVQGNPSQGFVGFQLITEEEWRRSANR